MICTLRKLQNNLIEVFGNRVTLISAVSAKINKQRDGDTIEGFNSKHDTVKNKKGSQMKKSYTTFANTQKLLQQAIRLFLCIKYK